MENNLENMREDQITEISRYQQEAIEEFSFLAEEENSEISKEELPIDLLEKNETTSLDWQVSTGLNEDSLVGVVESLIFMSEKPISLVKLKSLIDESIPLEIIHQSILKLQKEYDSLGHGIRPVEVASGYQFRTKTFHNKYIQKMFKSSTLLLTPQALEVLAIIAYRGPIARVDIDKIRGVDGSHLLRVLIDKKLVKVARKSDEATKGVLYSISDDFLELFGLNSVEDLPPEYELETVGHAEEKNKISDIREFVKGSNLRTEELKKEFDELDNLGLMIKDISSDTLFTKSLKSEEKKKFKGKEAEEEKEVNQTMEESPSSDFKESVLPVEEEKIKTAFELLEEFVLKEEIKEENIKAAATLFGPKDLFDQLFRQIGQTTPSPQEALPVEENLGADVIEENSVTDEDHWFSGDLIDDEEAELQDDAYADEIVSEAKELDIDLSFLKISKEGPHAEVKKDE